jgi:serine/threonine-protein kinase
LNKHRRLYFSVFIFLCFIAAVLLAQNSTLRWLDAQMFRMASHLLPQMERSNSYRSILLDAAHLQSPEGIQEFRFLLRKLRKSNAAEIVWLSDNFPQMDYLAVDHPVDDATDKQAAATSALTTVETDDEAATVQWKPTEGERNKLAWMLEHQKVFLTQYSNSPNIRSSNRENDIVYHEQLQFKQGWRQYIPSIFLPQARTFRLSNAEWPYRIYPFDVYARGEHSFIWYSEDQQFSLPDLSLAVFSQMQHRAAINWDESGSIQVNGQSLSLDLSGKAFSYFSSLTEQHTELTILNLQQAAEQAASYYSQRVVLIAQDAQQLQILADKLSSLEQGAIYATPVDHWWLSPLLLLGVVIYLLWILPLLSRHSGLFLGAFILLGIIVVQPLLLILQSIWWPTINLLLLLVAGQLAVYVYVSGQQLLNHVLDKQYAAWWQLGHYQYLKGDYETAIGNLLKCRVDDEVLDDLYEIALNFERKRQYDRALQIYSEMYARNKQYKDVERRLKSLSGLSDSKSDISTPLQAQKTLVLPEMELPEFGRYKLEKELGRGAMGVVYLGRDPKINRQVAIKTLDYTQFPTGELNSLKSRFFREAEAAGRLSHNSIVTVYDVGEEEGFAFIAMDYVNGEPLSNFTQPDSLLPIAEVYRIMQQVAEALDYAHQQNIVHRDIKPGNIMYNRETRQLKITDFGIARITDSVKTRTGSFMGSPSYMSPEQISGAHVDGRADLYALGVSFYQLLTGQLPFTADSLAGLAYKITHDKHKPVRDIRPELPGSATRIVNKALKKDPQKRYASGAEMASAFSRGLAAIEADNDD